MELIDILSPRPSSLWHLLKQCGVDSIAVTMLGAEQDERMFQSVGVGVGQTRSTEAIPPWSEAALARDQRSFARAGFEVAVIEDSPPLDLVRLGQAGRDQQIENVLTQVNAMGALGIPVLCYNWMALTSWSRTSVNIPSRGGALVTGYNSALAEGLESIEVPPDVNRDCLWDGLEYFLRIVIPEAERCNVRLAMHPDDPPRPMIRSVPRIMGSYDSFRRLIDIVDSPHNAITLCQGNFALMEGEMLAGIREFASKDRVAYVHMRDIQGSSSNFVETFHDAGSTDLRACMIAYEESGFRGPYRADHVPTMYGEENDQPGYGTLGRLFALGYLRGLEHGALSGATS